MPYSESAPALHQHLHASLQMRHSSFGKFLPLQKKQARDIIIMLLEKYVKWSYWDMPLGSGKLNFEKILNFGSKT
jgi:hypothetical protein